MKMMKKKKILTMKTWKMNHSNLPIDEMKKRSCVVFEEQQQTKLKKKQLMMKRLWKNKHESGAFFLSFLSLPWIQFVVLFFGLMQRNTFEINHDEKKIFF